MSIFSTPDNVRQERTIHTFLGLLSLTATILTIIGTVALILSQYRRASRSLSTRQGVQRRRLVVLFLGLAGVCFFVVTLLKYVDAGARTEVVDLLAGGFGEDKDAEAQRKWWGNADGNGNGNGENMVQVEVPSRLVHLVDSDFVGNLG
jgi:hypothetical protein